MLASHPSVIASYGYSAVDTDGSSSALPPVDVVSGLARHNNFEPSRHFREGRREASKLATDGGVLSSRSGNFFFPLFGLPTY